MGQPSTATQLTPFVFYREKITSPTSFASSRMAMSDRLLVNMVSRKANMKKKRGPGRMAPGKILADRRCRRKSKIILILVLTSPDFFNRIECFLNKAVSRSHHFHPYLLREGVGCGLAYSSFSIMHMKKAIIIERAAGSGKAIMTRWEIQWPARLGQQENNAQDAQMAVLVARDA